MPVRIAATLAAVFLAAACQLPFTSSACETTHIDWINFVKVGSTTYEAGPGPSAVLHDADLGPVYATVKFKVSDNVCDPNYRLKDGDAGFLEPGTPIYQVKGKPPGEELAARFNGDIVVYRAMTPTY